MGAQLSKQVERQKQVANEKKILEELEQSCVCDYPGSDYHPLDRKNWMSGLNPDKLYINRIVWPGTHNSATNKIGIKMITRPFAQCQSLSIYEQLVCGARLLDIRVQKNRNICHGILTTYSIDVVINDIKKFISETVSEIIILEIRTEVGHDDPPEFEKYLEEQLKEYLIHQDNNVFHKTIAQVLPKRIICLWKPSRSYGPPSGSLFWNANYLYGDWINTDLPATKFESNLRHLSQQLPVTRVGNTVTPRADNPVLCVKPVTNRIRRYARLFLRQCVLLDIVDLLQIFSTDFIDEDFVDACIGLTWARVEGKL
ncbi:PLC-like phosphodiesterases superfamily protein [Artemisia annua]|uniref:PLC-like phosphodiesterases superfamily protein n=1 Tax=Artemisia annua TaxID=35608 RepID=A0A2U1LRR2_ARTAN|nr:PLC-like phosphodiesterases superfamily protein [Artemisia annua]